MSLWDQSPKCKFCSAKLLEDNPQLKLNTSQGLVTIDMCESCADSFDMMRQKMVDKLEKNS